MDNLSLRVLDAVNIAHEALRFGREMPVVSFYSCNNDTLLSVLRYHSDPIMPGNAEATWGWSEDRMTAIVLSLHFLEPINFAEFRGQHT